MNERLPLGVIGAGSNAGGHLEACRVSGVATPVAICDIIKSRAETRSAQYGIEQTFTDYRKMLESDAFEAVIVSVPNNLHHEISIAALKAGKHVLCEKPMTIRVDWAQEMVKTAQETGKVLQVGMVSRHRPAAQWLREQVKQGDFGEVYFGRAQYVRRTGIPGWGSWFTQKQQSGGGPLIDIGVHVLDLTWWLMGRPKPVSVTGVTYAQLGPSKIGISNWKRTDLEGYFDVEDMATALIRFENGASILLEATWAGFTETSHGVSIMGSKSGARLDSEEILLMSEQDRHNIDTTVAVPAKGRSGFARQIESFVRTVRGETPCIAPAQDGLEVVKMLAGIYESAAQGREAIL